MKNTRNPVSRVQAVSAATFRSSEDKSGKYPPRAVSDSCRARKFAGEGGRSMNSLDANARVTMARHRVRVHSARETGQAHGVSCHAMAS
jgi:hypothetical protein